MNRYMMACAFLTIASAAYAGNVAGEPEERSLHSIYDVLDRIRQDVGYYEVQAASWRGDITPRQQDPALTIPAYDEPPDETHPQGQHLPARPVKSACPTANFDFDVSSVELSLRASTVDKKTGKFGLQIPYIGAGPDVDHSSGHTRDETIVLHREVPYDVTILRQYSASDDYRKLTTGHADIPSHETAQDDPEDPSKIFPISHTLIALRENLFRGSETLPCFDEKKNETNQDSISLEFQVQQSSNKDIGFTFKILSAQARDEWDNDMVNRITVTFAPHSKTIAKSGAIRTANR